MDEYYSKLQGRIISKVFDGKTQVVCHSDSYNTYIVNITVVVHKTYVDDCLCYYIECDIPYNTLTKSPSGHPFSQISYDYSDDPNISYIWNYVPDNELLKILFTHLLDIQICETQYATTGAASIISRIIKTITFFWD